MSPHRLCVMAGTVVTVGPDGALYRYDNDGDGWHPHDAARPAVEALRPNTCPVCEEPLTADDASLYFCGPDCQDVWHALGEA